MKIRSTKFVYFALAVVLIGSQNAAFGAGVTGLFDFRPSITPINDTAITDNSIELGYQFENEVSVSYLQGIQTGLMSRVQSEQDLDVKISDGFFRTRVSKIWESEASGWSMSYQGRLYTPTSSGSRDAGMITQFRNYLSFSKQFSPLFSLSLMDLPIFHIYSRSGNTVDGVASANPLFENRVYAIGSFQFTEKLSLSFPLMFHVTQYRDYATTAELNNDLGVFLWIYPELSYQINPFTTLGLAFYSGNLIESDMTGFTLGDGIKNGTIEVSLAFSI